MRRLHPLRLSYAIFGACNRSSPGLRCRRPGSRRPSPGDPDNLLALQERVSRQIVDGLDAWRKGAERLAEQTFHAIYATPALRAALGIDTASSAAAQGGAEQAARRWRAGSASSRPR